MVLSFLPAVLCAFFVLLAGGCAPTRPALPPLATLEGVRGHFAEGRILDLHQGKAIPFDQLIDDLGGMDVVFVGEIHNNPEHHLIQTQILQALMERHGPVTVAMEFFDTTRQPLLDQYLQGDLAEEDFLQQVGWQGSWGFPYHLYRPLILLARMANMPLVGINAPANVVKKVARFGLSHLSPEERALIANDIQLDHPAHRDHVYQAYLKHDHTDLSDFERFYEAQCVWEETMADQIAQFWRGRPQKMVVFVGNGHLVYKFGIPDRVMRRIDLNMAVMVLYPLTEATKIHKTLSDYVWLTSAATVGPRMPKPHRARPKNKESDASF